MNDDRRAASLILVESGRDCSISGLHFAGDCGPQFLGHPRTSAALLKFEKSERLTRCASTILNRPLIVRHDQIPSPAIFPVDQMPARVHFSVPWFGDCRLPVSAECDDIGTPSDTGSTSCVNRGGVAHPIRSGLPFFLLADSDDDAHLFRTIDAHAFR